MWNLIPAHSGVTSLVNCFTIAPFNAPYIFFSSAQQLLNTGFWTRQCTANSASYTNNVPFWAFKHRTMAEHIAAHINAFVYWWGEEGVRWAEAGKRKRRKEISRAWLHCPSIPPSPSFFSPPRCLYDWGKKVSFHHEIQADLYALKAKQTNIIFSVSRL